MTCDGDCHINRCDCLVTIRDLEGYVCKVVVPVRELVCRQAHVRCACICSLSCRIASEYEVFVYIIQIIACCCCISGYTMVLSIVWSGVARTSDGNGHINWIDGLVAVGYLEGYGLEVAVRVGELLCRQAHLSRTSIRSGSFCIATEGEVLRNIVQSAVRCCCITCYSMFCTVVICCVVCTDDCYLRINRIDGLVAVRYVEGYCSKVRICVFELVCRKSHISCSGIRSLSKHCSAECEVLRDIVQTAVYGCCVALYAVRIAVVVDCVICTDDGDYYVDWSDRLITICYVEGYCSEVRICVLELVCRKAHVGRADICSFRFCSTAEPEVLRYIVQITVNCCCVAVYTVVRTIICSRIAGTGDGNCYIDRCNRLVAIGYVKGYLRKVLIIVCELICCQTHIGRAGICSLCLSFAAE